MDYLKHNLKNKKQEVFSIIYLNGRNEIIDMEELFLGTLTSSVVYPLEAIQKVLKMSAAAIILVHNHPSGNPNPSDKDINITKKLVDAAKTIDVHIHDQIIIAGNDYYSCADHSLIYNRTILFGLACFRSKLDDNFHVIKTNS